MSNRFRVSAAIPRKLEDLGLSPAQVLSRASLPLGLLKQEKMLLTTEELFAFYSAIAEVGHDPAIGLKLGVADRIERYDPIAIAALCTRSFRDALARIARYKQITCPESIDVVEQGDESRVQFNFLLAQAEEPAILIDVCFAWLLSLARRGMGKQINPVRVEFRHFSTCQETYEQHFQAPVRFGSPQNALIFSKTDLDKPFVTHNADLLAAVAPQLETELSQRLLQKTIAEEVKAALKRLLAGQRPGIAAVARDLRMSTRTLQRRLTEDGVTFQQLMQEARRELAHHYLLHTSFELNETAYLLGYEDANSFFRAFQAWEGTTPGQWRAANSVRAMLRAAARTA
ncbi:MAG: AraC family transcriptional regulator ligand-binding domain-containing protein [Terriglobia bacterium]|nr:AraC family transcriptional regulator ligand-binding domain-containing protein [Terriglobia bacterium]